VKRRGNPVAYQEVVRLLSKKVHIQGVGVFQDRKHTY